MVRLSQLESYVKFSTFLEITEGINVHESNMYHVKLVLEILLLKHAYIYTNKCHKLNV